MIHFDYLSCQCGLYTLLTAASVVGLEQTLYAVSEEVNMVEVCVIIYSPVIDCPIAFPFGVKLITTNGSAGK